MPLLPLRILPRGSARRPRAACSTGASCGMCGLAGEVSSIFDCLLSVALLLASGDRSTDRLRTDTQAALHPAAQTTNQRGAALNPIDWSIGRTPTCLAWAWPIPPLFPRSAHARQKRTTTAGEGDCASVCVYPMWDDGQRCIKSDEFDSYFHESHAPRMHKQTEGKPVCHPVSQIDSAPLARQHTNTAPTR